MLDLIREKIKTAQDKDVEDKKGTQPKRYYAKMQTVIRCLKRQKRNVQDILQNTERKMTMTQVHTKKDPT